MGTRHHYSYGHALGAQRNNDEPAGVPHKNHFAASKISREAQARIDELGLVRVAGNVFECPSTKDFWKVNGNKVVRLSGGAVDNGEKVVAADAAAPDDFLSEILSDLTL